ncbi:hypothetical protein [Planktothrix mougeotii]|uniref:J domain-containing protein n=1 Tax=Planktothrix mougeotii LEGE 06226 TaxID=1828728 RepID=A0ABR9U8M0_9CYAN|nr:hypothetical protein [Planktothrix mougeotii]MBE9142807.1 hypothetical protein [Planktothrix mougeotii LEGE 06226]
MEWFQVKTLDDLKKLGSYKDIRQEIQNSLSERIALKARGWQELWEAVQAIQKVNSQRIYERISSPGNYISEKRNFSSENPEASEQFFISTKHKLAFCILKQQGGCLENEIGITREHYLNKDLAKKWRDEMINQFHPDKNVGDDSSLNNEVSQKITLIYKRLTGKA